MYKGWTDLRNLRGAYRPTSNSLMNAVRSALSATTLEHTAPCSTSKVDHARPRHCVGSQDSKNKHCEDEETPTVHQPLQEHGLFSRLDVIFDHTGCWQTYECSSHSFESRRTWLRGQEPAVRAWACTAGLCSTCVTNGRPQYTCSMDEWTTWHAIMRYAESGHLPWACRTYTTRPASPGLA